MNTVLMMVCLAQVAADEGRAWLRSRAPAQDTVEYALVAAGIAVLALAVIGILTGAVTNAAQSAATAVGQAASGASTARTK